MWHSRAVNRRKSSDILWNYDPKQSFGIDILYEETAWSIFTMYWPQISFFALIGKE